MEGWCEQPPGPVTLVGAVLAGGAGRRMGSAKPLVDVAGRPLAARVAEALEAAGASPVVLVGGPDAVGRALGRVVVADRWPGEGPLGGIASAVAWARTQADADLVVVAACDQPGLTPATVSALIDALTAPDSPVAGAVVATSDGRRHPFPAVWRVSAADDLMALVASGARRADAGHALGVTTVTRPASELVDLDTPADVERFDGADLRGHPPRR